MKYIYTIDKTPFSTCKRTIAGREAHRCIDNGKTRRHIRRHKIAVVKTEQEKEQ
jgi:hypothetical protein